MNTQLTQVRNWMLDRERTVRYTPCHDFPLFERFNQTQRLVEKLWDFLTLLGVDCGAKPCIVASDVRTTEANDAVLLSKLTELQAEVLATYHMLGLAPTLSRGMWAYTNRKLGDLPPNYRVIIDEVGEGVEEEGELFKD